ncbi:MAG: hypothetical protein HYY55_02290 [Candidatus Niyogibacteria bacterium]|nr:MAG: hypothetical protein HYY55_02290 [Candidatus Niyogibacteria bacterium]
MLKNAACSLLIACFLLVSVTAYGNSDKSLGYRYRASFEINDNIGKATVHVYTNTWVYNPNQGDVNVWLANPHPDIRPTGTFGSVFVIGCSMLVGKGIFVIERPNTAENKVEQHENMIITHSVSVYDFTEEVEIKFDRSKCR